MTPLTHSTPHVHFNIQAGPGSNKSLVLGSLDWELQPGTICTLGRHTENKAQQHKLILKSKVVSRQHAEIWMEKDKVYIRDIGSSSGTFLNATRLSPRNTVSEPYLLHDGDSLRIGTTYHDSHHDDYRCIIFLIRISLRPSLNQYSTETCCICIHPLKTSQALFVTPCGHLFHYKCSLPLLQKSYKFQCPICRSISNLDKDID
ncbi:SMAD/FHA domain-containing protein [Halteromyces radiatus]|uniref:SMAD/FHA domain-containing protein n=1 Tax=Halteromyces radiatus TaxID=101107 RepID=UPI00221F0EED|nr:SMAD/FHA domain-containing protein [Halteromyces radiatus]KAI8082907.1 SMAD/FHA domain-containing protein [Halteromyces radiatus]